MKGILGLMALLFVGSLHAQRVDTLTATVAYNASTVTFKEVKNVEADSTLHYIELYDYLDNKVAEGELLHNNHFGHWKYYDLFGNLMKEGRFEHLVAIDSTYTENLETREMELTVTKTPNQPFQIGDWIYYYNGRTSHSENFDRTPRRITEYSFNKKGSKYCKGSWGKSDVCIRDTLSWTQDLDTEEMIPVVEEICYEVRYDTWGCYRTSDDKFLGNACFNKGKIIPYKECEDGLKPRQFKWLWQ